MKYTTATPKHIFLAIALSSMALAGCSQSSSDAGLIAQARTAVEKNDFKAAEIHLKNLLQKTPDSAEARFLLGQVYFQAADFRSAEKELHRAIEAGYDRSKTVPTMFHAMLQVGEYQKIIDEHKNLAVEGNDVKARVLDQVARAYLALNKREDAQASFREALTLKPDLPAAKAGLIGILAVTDRAAAKSQVDALVKQAPESFETLILKGDLELAENQLVPARDSFIKAVQADPNNALARAKLGAIFIDLKNFKDAQTQINELRRMSPNSPAGMHLQALYEFRQGKLPAARDAVQLALKAAPDYLPSVALAGNIFLNLGQNEQAERQGRALVERAPQSLQGYRLLGAAYLSMNSPERALSTVMPVIQKGTKDSTLFTIAGEAHLKLNEPAKAGIYFEQAQKLDPTDASKRTGLALSRMASGDRDKAFDDLEAAVKLDTEGYQADFALIMARVKEKQFDKALEAVTNLEKKQPKNPLSQNLRGMVLLAKNDVPAARKAFDAALELDPAFFPAAANLASLDLRDNKPADARKRYESVLAKDPKNAQALIAMARHTARQGGSKQDVEKLLAQARTSNPGAVPPLLALANYHLENNQPREAIPLLQEGLRQHPDRTEILELLGVAYMRTNDRSQAVETYEKLIRLSPRNAALHYRMGELKASGADDNGALNAFRKAAELQPKAAEPRIAIASVLLRMGKKEEARTMAKLLQKDLPASPAGILLEGDLHAADQNWAGAAISFRKAFDVQKNAVTAGKLHQSLVRGGKAAEAETFLAEALAAEPKNMSLQLYAGENAIVTERWAKASEHYKTVLVAQPTNGVALNNLAWAAFKLNDPKALQYAEQAVTAMPQAPNVIDTLGHILVQTGNPSRGVEVLRQAVAISPKSADIRLHLAEGYAKLGNKSDAKKEIDQVLRDNPSPAIATQAKQLADKL
jgi:cellulose synthase operon protein C